VIRRPRPLHCAFAILLLALLAGCGQRGDLYLREKPPPGLKPERPAAYKPVPYPNASEEDKGAGESRK
jgi:predicted small lipoprotein YifL